MMETLNQTLRGSESLQTLLAVTLMDFGRMGWLVDYKSRNELHLRIDSYYKIRLVNMTIQEVHIVLASILQLLQPDWASQQ